METLNATDKDSTVDAVGVEVTDGKEQVVDSIPEEATSRSSVLRHSIAVMETSWSQATPVQDCAEREEPVLQCDTPASKELQESDGPSLGSRTLRDRSEATPTKSDAEPPVEHPTGKEEDVSKSPRRSSRLSLLGKATGVLDKATSVLGKRSRSMMEKGKEWSRRASLRPRNVIHPKGEKVLSAHPEPPAVKKRRVSESDLPTKAAEELPPGKEESPSSASALRFKPKRWLSHGLYIGQDRYMDPRLNEAKNRLKSATRNAPVDPQRTILPLPMFAGERLLTNGRDFRLPFDIFSPLPPGQPKPDEWRKTNKSKCQE
jgi:histone-lysine N-methyltransferase ASH1L